jgi:hypothetical protein
VLVACLIWIASLARGQSTNATLDGRITDQTGSLVIGAAVDAENQATYVVYSTKSNTDGLFVIPDLPPGTYEVRVSKDGFRTLLRPDIILNVQDVRALNATLQVGDVREIVRVEGGISPVNTESAAVSTTIDRNFAENLPLNGRSFQSLILLAPGTVITPDYGNGGTFSVNGQRTNSNTFTVDGVSANSGGYVYQSNLGQYNGANPNFVLPGTSQGMVAVDALQEFKIQTSTYSPEFGRQPGGQVSLLTRSGTNAFHGTGFDYLRNTALDANNWFNDRSHRPKGVERQNDFGGTLGGPILKDRTFFFFSYEGLRLLTPSTHSLTVPSLCLRGKATCPSGENPAAQVFQPILNAWPMPDGAEFLDGTGNPTGGAPYTQSQSMPTNLDSYSIKIDHALRKNIHLFGRYAHTSSSISDVGVPTAFVQSMHWNELTVGIDASLSPSITNELRANYTVNASTTDREQNAIGGAIPLDASLLVRSPLVSGRDVSNWNAILPNAQFSATAGTDGNFSQRQIAILDNASWSKGAHQVKWGVDYRRLFPIYAYSPLQTTLNINANDLSSSSDLSTGMISQASLTAELVAHPIFVNFSSYGADTWKISRRFALTYGLRWDFNPAPGERDGIQPLNVVGIQNPATATVVANQQMYKSKYWNFAPRIGGAFQLRNSPGNETVLRGGFGVFYDLNSEAVAQGFGHAPFSNLSSTSAPVPFPLAANAIAVPQVPAPLQPPYNTISAIDPDLQLPYTLQWNVSLEQAFGRNQSLTISYVGAAASRLLRSDALFNINSNFSNLYVTRNASSSNYQALQAQFNRRLTRGLQGLVSYTYSHSIDDASDANNGLGAQDGVSGALNGSVFVNPRIDRGSSDFDQRHAFRGALTYDVPTWSSSTRFERTVLGGWAVDMIGLAQSGLPVNLIGGAYFPVNYPNGILVLRPNIVAGEPLYISGQQYPGGRTFNPAAFVPVPTDATGNPTQIQGNLGRNVMRGFGAWQMDFALHRRFNITERVYLQFRSEFFNLFNHPNFACIDNFVGDGAFGQSRCSLNRGLGGLSQLYQIGGPRSIQLALKLYF